MPLRSFRWEGPSILLAETNLPRNNVIDYSLEIPGFLCTSQMDSLKFTVADLKGPCVHTCRLGGCSPLRKKPDSCTFWVSQVVLLISRYDLGLAFEQNYHHKFKVTRPLLTQLTFHSCSKLGQDPRYDHHDLDIQVFPRYHTPWRWSLYREICITKAMQLMWRWSPSTRNTRCTAHRDSDLSFHKRFGSHDHQFVVPR